MPIYPPAAELSFGFYDRYIRKTETELLGYLEEQTARIRDLVHTAGDTLLHYRYAPGKWTIREILVHLIDAERNFAYRLMRFSRGLSEVLPGFDPDHLLAEANTDNRSTHDLVEEFTHQRKSIILQLKGCSEEMLERSGPARDTVLSVRAIGYAIAGHAEHHLEIIKERYLTAAAVS